MAKGWKVASSQEFSIGRLQALLAPLLRWGEVVIYVDPLLDAELPCCAENRWDAAAISEGDLDGPRSGRSGAADRCSANPDRTAHFGSCR